MQTRMMRKTFDRFVLSGTPYEIGRTCGERDRANVRRVLAHHADLSSWSGMPLVDVRSLRVNVRELFGGDGWDELQGMADGAGVSVESLVYHNLQIFGVGGCTHFAGCDEQGDRFCHGANIDVPMMLLLRDSLSFHIQERFPKGGRPYYLLGMTGMLGSIGGWNETGLFLSGSMLLDWPLSKQIRKHGTGTLHGVIVMRLLRFCETLDDAVRLLSCVDGWGAWGIGISHLKSRKTVYAEYHGNRVRFGTAGDGFVCSNHSRLLTPGIVPEHSKYRLARLETLLKPETSNGAGRFRGGFGEDQGIPAILFDRFDLKQQRRLSLRTMNTVFRVDHAASVWADDTQRICVALTEDAEQHRTTFEQTLTEPS